PALPGNVPRLGGVKATQLLTSTHFDPAIYLDFRKMTVVSHRVNELIYMVHGTSFRSRSEKGNTGGHGAPQGQEKS
ncbi:hypothetical protein, partial [Hungatella effluvii]|uniref:hypothetical protein n=1 Tax=Hungatella effluvii TaxID=1096246 RepID=UPI002A84128B